MSQSQKYKMDKESGTEDSILDNRPSPDDFELYLPWACKQLQMETNVQVTKVYQNEYICVAMTERSKRGKSIGKLTRSRLEFTARQDKEDRSTSPIPMLQTFDKVIPKAIKILAIYDNIENLVQIKFENNVRLPRILIKIVGLIIQFQKYLNGISINRGLDEYTVYEISKFLPDSHITDICLNDCSLKEPNFHILLDKANLLKYLSLCRCKIEDATVISIFSRLIYPQPASKSLSILNLSSNKITDEGAEFIANTLRSNRQLSYLNLSSNMITDKGAEAIMNSLMEFPLTREEYLAAKSRQMTFLRNKNDLIAQTIQDLKLGDFDKKSPKRKSIRPPTVPKKTKVDKDSSQKSLIDNIRCLDTDSSLFDKAVVIVSNAIGEFIDPFSSVNTHVRNGVTYCKGNNTLCCLNLSFNYLTYLTLRNVQSVLIHQRLLDRKPRGLMTLSVEGNYMPIACKELSQIENILEINLMTQTRKLSINKRRPQPRGTPR